EGEALDDTEEGEGGHHQRQPFGDREVRKAQRSPAVGVGDVRNDREDDEGENELAAADLLVRALAPRRLDLRAEVAVQHDENDRGEEEPLADVVASEPAGG